MALNESARAKLMQLISRVDQSEAEHTAKIRDMYRRKSPALQAFVLGLIDVRQNGAIAAVAHDRESETFSKLMADLAWVQFCAIVSKVASEDDN